MAWRECNTVVPGVALAVTGRWEICSGEISYNIYLFVITVVLNFDSVRILKIFYKYLILFIFIYIRFSDSVKDNISIQFFANSSLLKMPFFPAIFTATESDKITLLYSFKISTLSSIQ